MSIIKRLNGRYLVDILDQYGSRIRRTFEKYSDAQAFETKIKNEKYEKKLIGLSLKKSRHLVKKEITYYQNSKADLRPKSVQKYSHVIKQIELFIESCGVKYIDEFTTEHATQFKEALINGNGPEQPKPKTINFYLMVLKAFFREQFIKGNVERDPTIHLKNVRHDKVKPDYYTSEELKAFFLQPMHESYKTAFLGLLLTGLRFAELANLKWKHVNLYKKILIVESDGNFRTKTKNSERVVPISDYLFEILEDLKCNDKEDYVFRTPNGKQLRERRLLERCKVIAKRAGIFSNATLHKFRHTFATFLILNGVQIQNIKELLGHSTIVQTEIYAHNKSDHLHSDVKILDNIFETE